MMGRRVLGARGAGGGVLWEGCWGRGAGGGVLGRGDGEG